VSALFGCCCRKTIFFFFFFRRHQSLGWAPTWNGGKQYLIRSDATNAGFHDRFGSGRLNCRSSCMALGPIRADHPYRIYYMRAPAPYASVLNLLILANNHPHSPTGPDYSELLLIAMALPRCVPAITTSCNLLDSALAHGAPRASERIAQLNRVQYSTQNLLFKGVAFVPRGQRSARFLNVPCHLPLASISSSSINRPRVIVLGLSEPAKQKPPDSHSMGNHKQTTFPFDHFGSPFGRPDMRNLRSKIS